MELGLSGKSVIVTGGASNIGRAIVLAFAREGANTVIADIDESQGERVVQEAKRLSSSATTMSIATDVTDHLSVENMLHRAAGELGQLHILINSVGWTVDRPFLEKPRHEWEKEVQLNLWGAINCIRAILPSMVEHRYGRIVSIASDAGRMGEFREAVYSACKAGIIALSKAIAREVGRSGVCLNCVAPGLVVPESIGETGENSMWQEMGLIFTPEILERVKQRYVLRRLGTADEIAHATVFLSSDAASFITGQTLSVSGGYTMM